MKPVESRGVISGISTREGNNFHVCPHFYCVYADNGMAYERFAYYLIPEDNSYEFELPLDERVSIDELLKIF